MLTDVQIINNGLSKGASSRIKRIDPPSSPLEQFMAANYAQWKRSELAKRRWVFAMEKAYPLTAVSTTIPGDQPYKYSMPIDCLRPVRGKRTEWVQRGRFIYSAYENLSIDYVRNAPEAEWDPLFNDVMSARVWKESCEYVTQSTAKQQVADQWYREAISEAGKANAFVIGPEDLDEVDNEPSWLEAREYV